MSAVSPRTKLLRVQQNVYRAQTHAGNSINIYLHKWRGGCQLSVSRKVPCRQSRRAPSYCAPSTMCIGHKHTPAIASTYTCRNGGGGATFGIQETAMSAVSPRTKLLRAQQNVYRAQTHAGNSINKTQEYPAMLARQRGERVQSTYTCRNGGGEGSTFGIQEFAQIINGSQYVNSQRGGRQSKLDVNPKHNVLTFLAST